MSGRTRQPASDITTQGMINGTDRDDNLSRLRDIYQPMPEIYTIPLELPKVLRRPWLMATE